MFAEISIEILFHLARFDNLERHNIQNLLVEHMAPAVRDDLMGAGAAFEVAAGETIAQSDLDGSFVFLVTRGIASKFQRGEVGQISEVGMVGNEGAFPISALLRVVAAPHIVLSQVGSLSGRKIRTKDFHAIVDSDPKAQQLVHRYIYAFFAQIASNIMTSEQNHVRTRAARWLLMCHDRLPGDDIHVTHDMLAQMAFAHRPTITNVLHAMRRDGLVDLGRGRITILSRPELWIIADGSYGYSEKYWNEHIGPFGKGGHPLVERRPLDVPAVAK